MIIICNSLVFEKVWSIFSQNLSIILLALSALLCLPGVKMWTLHSLQTPASKRQKGKNWEVIEKQEPGSSHTLFNHLSWKRSCHDLLCFLESFKKPAVAYKLFLKESALFWLCLRLTFFSPALSTPSPFISNLFSAQKKKMILN